MLIAAAAAAPGACRHRWAVALDETVVVMIDRRRRGKEAFTSPMNQCFRQNQSAISGHTPEIAWVLPSTDASFSALDTPMMYARSPGYMY
jgi:hypothetical protein